MARGESILPCQLVDVEMRLKMVRPNDTGLLVNTIAGPCALQYRKKIRDDHGNVEWSPWENVPVVTEEI